jgi:hypothetical protein
MNLKNNQKAVSLFCVLILGALIYFGFRPFLSSLNSVNIDLKTKKTELSQKENKLDSLKNIKTKMATYNETLAVMQRALPKGEDLPSLLVSTESLVGSSGLGLSSFTPPGTTAQGGTSNKQAASSASVGEETATTSQSSQKTKAVPTSVTEATGVASSAYSLGLNGSYGAFLTLLDNINKNIRPTVVNSIQVSGSGDSLNINLELTTYYQK